MIHYRCQVPSSMQGSQIPSSLTLSRRRLPRWLNQITRLCATIPQYSQTPMASLCKSHFQNTNNAHVCSLIVLYFALGYSIAAIVLLISKGEYPGCHPPIHSNFFCRTLAGVDSSCRSLSSQPASRDHLPSVSWPRGKQPGSMIASPRCIDR